MPLAFTQEDFLVYCGVVQFSVELFYVLRSREISLPISFGIVPILFFLVSDSLKTPVSVHVRVELVFTFSWKKGFDFVIANQ